MTFYEGGIDVVQHTPLSVAFAAWFAFAVGLVGFGPTKHHSQLELFDLTDFLIFRIQSFKLQDDALTKIFSNCFLGSFLPTFGKSQEESAYPSLCPTWPPSV